MSNDEAPSVWTLDRDAIEATLVAGRSARREYSDTDKAAIREVLDRADFDHLSEYGRSTAFTDAVSRLSGVIYTAPVPTAPRSPLATAGWVMVVVAAVELATVYLGYGTSVHSDTDYVAGSFIPARDTLNIGLLQNQLMLFQLGLVILLAGLMFIGLSVAVNAVTTRDRV